MKTFNEYLEAVKKLSTLTEDKRKELKKFFKRGGIYLRRGNEELKFDGMTDYDIHFIFNKSIGRRKKGGGMTTSLASIYQSYKNGDFERIN